MPQCIRDPGYENPSRSLRMLATCNCLAFTIPEKSEVDISTLQLSRLGEDYAVIEDYQVYRVDRTVMGFGLRPDTNHLLYTYDEGRDAIIMMAQARTKEKKISPKIRFGINTRLYLGPEHFKLPAAAVKGMLLHSSGEYLWSDCWSYRFWRDMFTWGLFALPHKETILIPHPRERYCVTLPTDPKVWMKGKKLRKYRNSFYLSINMDFETDLTVLNREKEMLPNRKGYLGGNRKHLGGNRECLGGNSKCLGGNGKHLGGNRKCLGGSRKCLGGNRKCLGGNRRNLGISRKLLSAYGFAACDYIFSHAFIPSIALKLPRNPDLVNIVCALYHEKVNQGTWLDDRCLDALLAIRDDPGSSDHLRFIAWELRDAETGNIAALSMGFILGSVFHDFTASTPIRDHRSAGRLLLRVEGHMLSLIGVKLWYLGFPMPYMRETLDDFGGRCVPRSEFVQIWQDLAYAPLPESPDNVSSVKLIKKEIAAGRALVPPRPGLDHIDPE
ncbi:hypothetical protein FOL47_002037 [Perkinsus chesapeaki]|uniref:Uncharacterized protein n=1 Tax=Perkinsus chesapeaki TaxID=330153 RepID=A0A7J6MFS0_PERCH|nr:hypothetical protein FOL47_002037 [Perkinsus chesapeaki]